MKSFFSRDINTFRKPSRIVFSILYLVMSLFCLVFGLNFLDSYGLNPILTFCIFALGFYNIYGCIRCVSGIGRRIPAPKTRTISISRKKKPASLPKVSKKIPVEYQTRLDQLQKYSVDLKERQSTVSEFLDDFFGQSEISKARYKNQIQEAINLVDRNLRKGTQAVKIFGDSTVTEQRIEILDNYVEDSRDVHDKVEHVIDALIIAQQNNDIKDGDLLDERLEELASTTAYYQKNYRE